MIYLDSSVALAQIRSENRKPEPSFWLQTLTSSQLLRYEVWNTLHRYRDRADRHRKARDVLRRIHFVELSETTLVRALTPFTVQVRALDSLHLGTTFYLRLQGADVKLASYDARLLDAATAEGFDTVQP